MRPGNSGSLASNSATSRSVQRAICRNVVTPRLCSIRSSTGPTPTISFMSSGSPIAAGEEGGRGVGLEVDHQLAIARGFAARVREIAEQAFALTRKLGELSRRRITGGQLRTQHRGLAVGAAEATRVFGAAAV